jgi:hypothetical protein
MQFSETHHLTDKELVVIYLEIEYFYISDPFGLMMRAADG